MTQKEIVAEFGELLNQLEKELVEANTAVDLAVYHLENALEGETLKLYACADAHGVYLHAVGIVFAHDEEEARKMMRETLIMESLEPSDFTLKELPIQPGAVILWNGDY